MLNKLKEWHKEELADQKKYLEMANDSPDVYKGIFKDIAKEEGLHAKLLEAIINDYEKNNKVEESIVQKEPVVQEEPKHFFSSSN